jgi:hypothetical protein
MVHCQCKHPRNIESTCSKNTHHANLSLEVPLNFHLTLLIQLICSVPKLPALTDVEATVNLRWDGANFCPQILLHPSQVVCIIVSDQVNCQTKVAKPS